MTNYDKIKQMTIDEMILFLNSCEFCTLWGTADCDCERNCSTGIKHWLLQEVEE